MLIYPLYVDCFDYTALVGSTFAATTSSAHIADK